MRKTAVYRWRLNPDLKQNLEAASRAEKISVGRLLDRIVREWLAKHEAEEEELQRRLHAEAPSTPEIPLVPNRSRSAFGRA